MRVLLLQALPPAARGRPVFSHSLGVRSSLLKYDGFEVHLLAVSGHQPRAIHQAVVNHRPQMIVADLTNRTFSMARRNLVTFSERYPLPVLAVGQYATCRPAKAFAFPGVRGLIVGEYERPAAAWLAALRDGREPEGVAGLWHADEEAVIRSPMGGLNSDLDELPEPDRTLFDTGAAVQQTGELLFKVARGCPRWCAYCINDWYLDLYGDDEDFVRRRSVENVLDEVCAAVATWTQTRRVVFLDHCFAMDDAWLEQFARDYPSRCGLPLKCHVRLETLTARQVDLLARSGCRWAHTQIVSGSDFIRNEIFSMGLSGGQIVDGCRLLKEAGIAVSADIFLGCPYETEITLEETIRLAGRCDLDSVTPRIYFPLPGTRAAELCHDNGWIGARGSDAPWSGASVLEMPALPADRIEAVFRRYSALLRRRGPAGLEASIRRFLRGRGGLTGLFMAQ